MHIRHSFLIAVSIAAASVLYAIEPVFTYSTEAGHTQAVDRAGHAVTPVETSRGIIYPADAVPRACGSIEVWLRPNEKGATDGDRFILCGPNGWGPTGCPVLWRWESYIRFDVDGGQRLVYGRVTDGLWRAGILNHLVATWNASGRIALYANGRLVSRCEVKPWTPEPFATVVIGSNGQGRRQAEAEIRSLRFYERELTPEEVGARFAAVKMPILTTVSAGHEVLVGPVESLALTFSNVGTAVFRGDIQIGRKGSAPQVFTDVDIPVGGSSILEVKGPFAPESDGRLLVESHWHEGPDLSLTRADQTVFYVPPPLEPPASREPEWRRIRAFDPAAEEPAAALGSTAIAVLPDGFRYREGGNGKHNRFAYVCELPGTNLLLRFRVKVPDDKKRAMMISQTQPDFARTATCGTEQQVLGSGVMCGGEVPLSGSVLELEYVFRHPSRWIGLIFEATAPGEPAAAGPFSIDYAVASDRYGPAATAPANGARSARRAGLYWEDPILSMNFGGLGGVDYVAYDRDLRRAMDYFAWTGQNLMFYPTVWYNGPVYASRAEKGSWPSGQRHHPAEFPRLFAARCSERGITFVPDLAMSMLPSLLPRLATPEAVRAGADAPNAVYADGTITTGAARMERPPVLNALHPEVQPAVAVVIEEQLAMCADLPAFGGVSLYLNMWNPTQFGLWLESSYDDWTMRAFARFRGEPLPGDPKSPDRFTLRANWIGKDPIRREAFLNWRVNKVCTFYEALAQRIVAAKPDAKLYLRIDVPNIALDCISGGIFKKGPTSADSFREMGLDVARLARNPAIVLDRLLSYGIVRNEEQYRPRSKMPHPFADLEEAFQQPLLGFCDAITIHQYYFETHGDIRRGKTMTMPAPWTREALGRCAAPLFPGRHMLGYYAKSLALFDPFEISTGGFTLGTHGAEALISDWTRAFRALPAVKFSEVQRMGPVRLRVADAEGYHWYYLLNAGETETNIVLEVSGACVDATTGVDMKPGTLALPAYDLRAFRLPTGSGLKIRNR